MLSSPLLPGAAVLSPPSPPISVAYLIDSLRRHGTQAALASLVRGLGPLGYDQRVYSLNDAADPEVVAALQASGARVELIGKRRLLAASGLWRLYREFRQWRPSIVQTFLPYSDLIGRTLAHLAGTPAVVTSIRTRNADKRQWQLLLDRATMHWADRVVFNSQAVIAFSMAREGVTPGQAVYIPNAVSPAPVVPAVQVDRLRSELGLAPDALALGAVARLYRQKGHRFLLSAFQRVSSRFPQAVLLLVGDGPLRQDLQRQCRRAGIADKVRFLGQRSDIPALLAVMDLVLHPALWEGMSNAVMEAMAAGKPVIATDVDGARELIRPGETGWLVAPGDAEALASQIIAVLERWPQAQSTGALAAQEITATYSFEKMVARYDRLYRQLVAEAGRTRP